MFIWYSGENSVGGSMLVANRWWAEAVGMKAKTRLRAKGASITDAILLVVSPPPAVRDLGFL